MPLPGPVIGPVPPGSDPVEYDRMRRRVLWSFPTGLYLVGSASEERWNLMTASWVMQVSTSPKAVAVAVEQGSVTEDLITNSGAFAVCVLDRNDRPVVRKFVKPVFDIERSPSGAPLTLSGERVHIVGQGLPVLARALGWVVCRVCNRVDQDSHALFVGEVTDAGERASPDDAGGRGPVSPSGGPVLRMEDTRMNYGG